MQAYDAGLACRLLHACQCLYGIEAGRVTGDEYYAGCGFLEEPRVFEAGPLDIDACLVGRTSQGVVLAFRGTILLRLNRDLIRSLRDWLNDFEFVLAPAPALPGKVHTGFAESLARLWPGVRAEVERLARDGAPLHVTGHSKGAVMACYAALRLAREAGITAGSVYTFGSPHVGNLDFVRAYEAAIGTHWRIEARDDLVPFLPPNLGALGRMGDPLRVLLDTHVPDDYRTVGTLHYIDHGGAVPEDPEALFLRRLAHLAFPLATAQLKTFVDDHLLPTGYLKGVCRPS